MLRTAPSIAMRAISTPHLLRPITTLTAATSTHLQPQSQSRYQQSPYALQTLTPRHLHTSAPRENVWLIVGGLGLLSIGVGYAYKAIYQPLFTSNTGLGVPNDHIPLPGRTDPHTLTLQKAFYEGGFEDHMSKSEAARILGVRETATRERVLERYRSLMKINHPDRGGSPFLSLKVNEAKEVLSKSMKESDGPTKGGKK